MKKLWTYRLCPRRWRVTLHCITVIKNCVNISRMSKYGEKTPGDVSHIIFSLQHKHRLSILWSCCYFYRMQVRLLSTLVSNYLNHLLDYPNASRWSYQRIFGKLQWQRKFDREWEADVWLRFWGWNAVVILKVNFGQYLEAEVWSRIKVKFGSRLRFGRDFEADVWSDS